MTEFLNKYIKVIILFIVIVLTLPVSLNIFGATFNFADNFGYAKTIELLKLSIEQGTPFYITENSFFLNDEYKIYFITPLWQIFGVLASYFIPAIVFINTIIILSLYLNIYFSYKLFTYISKNNYILSFLASIIFGASSLVLYATWFNLMGLFFIPLIIINLIKYFESGKNKNLVLIFLFLILIGLCSTYFLPIIGIILLPFILFNLTKYKKIFIIILGMIICFGIVFGTYKLPFKVLEGYGEKIEINNLLEERKVNSNIDLVNLFIPNNNNLYSKYQLKSTKKISTVSTSYFRYSNYLPFPILLLILILFLFRIGDKSKTIQKDSKISFIIILSSLILFLGDRIVINGFDLGVYNIFYYIKQLPNGEVLRKSAYFFFPLTFGISFLIVSSFRKNIIKEQNTILSIFAILILAMNIGPYYGKGFYIQEYNRGIEKLYNDSTILALPNTGYNNWEFQYNLLQYKKGFKTIEYGNATLPNYVKDIQYGSDLLDKFAYNKNILIEQNCNFGVNIDYIILYKNYIENFFFYSNESKVYQNAEVNISKCTNIKLEHEDNQLKIYNIN